MKSFSDQYEEVVELQRKAWQPMQEVGATAVQVFERIARKNYEVIGDVVEFSVAQLHLPLSAAKPQDLIEQQGANARHLADQVNARASEYVALSEELGDVLGESRDTVSRQLSEVVQHVDANREDAVSAVAEQTQAVADESVGIQRDAARNVESAAAKAADATAGKTARKAGGKKAAAAKASASKASAAGSSKKAGGAASTDTSKAGRKSATSSANGRKPATGKAGSAAKPVAKRRSARSTA